MSIRPVFSLLHATARPDGWREAYFAWIAAADHPERVEYILCVDRGGAFDGPGFSYPERGRIVWNDGPKTPVAAWNAAARASHGAVLVVVADDYFPSPGWDTALIEAIPDLDAACVVHVNAQDPWPDIMTHPVLTRAYYERAGRGGCPAGELFYPDYVSMGADDDFTAVAQLDNVVVDARHSIKFEHRHPALVGVPSNKWDASYRNTHTAEAWRVRARVLERRKHEGFGRFPRLKSLAVVTPGTDFRAEWLAEWDVLFWSLWGRFDWRRVYGQSNNIYQVRETTARCVLEGGVPDYVLWIDSDNPPKAAAFQALVSQMQAAERNTDPSLPPIDVIGAWYRYAGPDDGRSYIAAGRDFGLDNKQVPESDVLAALGRNELIEDLAYIGFGMLLMRGTVFAKLGPAGFWPLDSHDSRGYLTDDVSWCARAKNLGYRIYLHPGAFVEHLKMGPVRRMDGGERGPALEISISREQQKQLEVIAS